MLWLIGWLFQYREYEQVVVEDRIEKEKARRKQEQEAIELKASIKVGVLYFRMLLVALLSKLIITQTSISPQSRQVVRA